METRFSGRDGRVVFPGPRTLEFVPAEMPQRAQTGKLLLRTRWTMISTGTELAFYQGYHAGLDVVENPWSKYPFRPGYCAISTVMDVGVGVTGFTVGERVFHWGNHASWSEVDPAGEVALKVPAGVDEREVMLVRFAQIAATAAVRIGAGVPGWPAPGWTAPGKVLVIGAGLIGILAARWLELMGCGEVVLEDINAARLAIAAKVGLRTQHPPAAGSAGAEVRYDLVVEATGVKGLIGGAMGRCRMLGTVVMLGSPGGEQMVNLYKEVFLRGIALVGAHEARVPVMVGGADGVVTRKALNEAALAEMVAGRLRAGALMTSTLHYTEIEKAYEGLIERQSENLATVIDWGA